MRRARARSGREPTIALINIVFLMLVFFMVAGTLARPLGGDLNLVRTAALDGRAPPDALVVHSNGRLSHRGETLDSVQQYLDARTEEERRTVRLVPDRDLPAHRLVALARDLRAGGAGRVLLVTERALR